MEPYFIAGFKNDSADTSQFQSSVDDDFLLLLDRLSFGFEDDIFPLLDTSLELRMTEEEYFWVALLLGVEDEEPILVADEAPPLVEDEETTFLLLLDIVFLLLLVPALLLELTFLDEELRDALDKSSIKVEDDDDSSSFTDAPLSPPQATRAMASGTAKNNFLILYSFPSIYPTTRYINSPQEDPETIGLKTHLRCKISPYSLPGYLIRFFRTWLRKP